MAVVPNDLKVVGGGKLEPGLMFPDETTVVFDARLQKYIDEAVAKAAVAGLPTQAAKDAATKQWAYHRAFEAQFIRLSSTPASVTLNDQGAASFLQQQIQNFKDLAVDALDQFEELTPAPAESIGDGWNSLTSLRH